MRVRRLGVALAALLLWLTGPSVGSAAAQRPATWKLDPTPILTLGGGDGPQDLLRVSRAFRLADGRIVVANGGTRELRVFSADGRPIGSLGRAGSGPGEFQSLGWVGRAGDTVLVYDPSLRRLTSLLFAPTGRLLGSMPFTASGNRLHGIEGRLENGDWLVAETIGTPPMDGPSGLRRIPGSVGVARADGTGSVRWLATMPNRGFFVISPTGHPERALGGVAPLAPYLAVAAIGPDVWIGDTAVDTVLRFPGAGGTAVPIRLPVVRRAPSAVVVSRSLAAMESRATSEEGRQLFRRIHQAPFLPQLLPAFAGLIATSNGTHVWVPEYAADDSVTRHLVYSRTGELLATIDLPAGLSLRDAGPGWVLGVTRDADDVEFLRLYRLDDRPATGRE